jgi:hypothetical protein
MLEFGVRPDQHLFRNSLERGGGDFGLPATRAAAVSTLCAPAKSGRSRSARPCLTTVLASSKRSSRMRVAANQK